MVFSSKKKACNKLSLLCTYVIPRHAILQFIPECIHPRMYIGSSGEQSVDHKRHADDDHRRFANDGVELFDQLAHVARFRDLHFDFAEKKTATSRLPYLMGRAQRP